MLHFFNGMWLKLLNVTRRTGVFSLYLWFILYAFSLDAETLLSDSLLAVLCIFVQQPFHRDECISLTCCFLRFRWGISFSRHIIFLATRVTSPIQLGSGADWAYRWPRATCLPGIAAGEQSNVYRKISGNDWQWAKNVYTDRLVTLPNTHMEG